MLTLEAPRIIETKTRLEKGLWYLIVIYNDEGEDEYGPFNSEQEAKRFIF